MGLSFEERPDRTKGTRVCKKRTICEVHRELHDRVYMQMVGEKAFPSREWPQIKALLEEAFGMGVAMTKSLLDHKLSLPKWDKNVNLDELKRLRQLRVELETARLEASSDEI